MIETVSQFEKRRKVEFAEREARAQRYAAKMNGAMKSDAPITKEEARLLTIRIVDASEGLAQLLLEAHRREAWKPLGYDSWRAYAMAEFKFSKSRAYQLMDHAAVLEVISPNGKNSTNVEKTSEGVTRPLVPMTPTKQRKVWDEAVRSSPNGKPTAKTVAAAIVRITKPATVKLHGGIKNSPVLRQLKTAWKKHLAQLWKSADFMQRSQFREWIAQ